MNNLVTSLLLLFAFAVVSTLAANPPACVNRTAEVICNTTAEQPSLKNCSVLVNYTNCLRTNGSCNETYIKNATTDYMKKYKLSCENTVLPVAPSQAASPPACLNMAAQMNCNTTAEQLSPKNCSVLTNYTNCLRNNGRCNETFIANATMEYKKKYDLSCDSIPALAAPTKGIVCQNVTALANCTLTAEQPRVKNCSDYTNYKICLQWKAKCNDASVKNLLADYMKRFHLRCDGCNLTISVFLLLLALIFAFGN